MRRKPGVVLSVMFPLIGLSSSCGRHARTLSKPQYQAEGWLSISQNMKCVFMSNDDNELSSTWTRMKISHDPHWALYIPCLRNNVDWSEVAKYLHLEEI